MRRVVVTGVGLVTPLGVGVSTVWPKVLKGESGIRGLGGEEYSKLPCRVAARVPQDKADGK
jgi:3-oxoacyl-[acyl-carrier-protein] synthase II